MIMRLTSPQKPSEQLALDPILNSAAAIAAVPFRARGPPARECERDSIALAGNFAVSRFELALTRA
jgi:hypothetical protein